MPPLQPRASAALDGVIARERAWLDFMVTRFITHPALAEVFVDYLVAAYHSMRTAGAVMEAARSRSATLAAECAVAARLVPYWTQHIAEEAGHDEWLLEDLRGPLGVDAQRVLAAPPPAEVAELMGTLHFWVLHAHPVAALSYFYVVERNVASVQVLDWIAAATGLPREGMRTLYRHAAIDVAHGRELEDLLDELPLTEAHRELLARSATTVLRQLTRILERHLARADDILAARRGGGVRPSV